MDHFISKCQLRCDSIELNMRIQLRTLRNAVTPMETCGTLVCTLSHTRIAAEPQVPTSSRTGTDFKNIFVIGIDRISM